MIPINSAAAGRCQPNEPAEPGFRQNRIVADIPGRAIVRTPTAGTVAWRTVAAIRSKPSFIVRFRMDATNPAALYAPNGNMVGPEQVLVMTVPAKTTRTFYGTEDLAYSAGAWPGPTTLENPADKLGKPIVFYTVPTPVLGSDQYKTAVAQPRRRSSWPRRRSTARSS